MPDTDAPGPLAMPAYRQNIAADIDQRIAYSLRTQQFGGAIQRVTFA